MLLDREAGTLYWCVIVLGALTILSSARGDLWLDEIWSFEWVRRATTPWDVLTVFRHDNNHPLNTWWMMFLGEGQAMIVYRLPAILCGIVSLLLIGRTASILEPGAQWIAVLLAAFSFPLVLYFSEARGYAPAVACSLAAAAMLLENQRRPSWSVAAFFWLVCGAGMLSHATFLFVLAPLGVWKTLRIVCASNSLPDILQTSMRWFMVPGLAACAYYLGFLRLMQVGGGPEYSLPAVLGHFFSYALALPVSGRWGFWSMAIGSGFYVCAVIFGLRENRRGVRWLFMLLPFPVAAALWMARPEILYFRYFLVFLPFFYIVLAVALARMAVSGAWGYKMVSFIFLAAYLAGQAPRLIALGAVGRGGYREALTLIADSPFANKEVTSDHDFRNGILITFYRGRETALANVGYIPFSEARRGQAGWLIRHSQEPLDGPPEKTIQTKAGKYCFVATFPYAGVSGWHWLLYRAEPAMKLPWDNMAESSHDGKPSSD